MGKARTFSDSSKDSVYQKEYDDEIYSAANQQNSYNLGSTHFSDQSGIGNFAQSGDDKRKANLKGALFTGNIGFELQTAVLDVGSDTIDLLEDSSSTALSLVSTDRIVTLSAGSVADLTTITGAQRPGQRLCLYNTTGNVITVKNNGVATVNTILTPDGNDFTFENNMAIEFVYDTTTSQWRLVTGISGGSGSGGGGNVPDGTSQFQHLEWDGAAWIAQQTLAFGALSASSAQLNIPNNTIGLAWRNATNDGNLELKGTTGGNLDITRDDNTSISLDVRSQNAIEADQALSITVGSGSITTADCVIDASTAKLLIAAGGATRLTLDTTSITELTLKSPSGVTAQSAFNITSTHVSEADQTLSFNVGSGSVINTDSVMDASTGKLKFAVGGAQRLEIDATVTTAMTLASPSGVTAQSSFSAVSTHVSENDQDISIFVGSGDSADAVLSTSANVLELAVGNVSRWQIDINVGNEITQTAFSINPVYDLFRDNTTNDDDIIGTINFSADNSISTKTIFASIFVESTDVTNSTEDATLYFSTMDGGVLLPSVSIAPGAFNVVDRFIELDEIAKPSNPGTNEGRIYLKDDGGTTTPFFLDSSGVETSMIAGSTGANTTLSNLTSPTAVNQDLLPSSTGLRLLGSTSLRWLTTSTDRIRLTTSTNTIFESSTVMTIDADNELQFKIGAVNAGKIVDASTWDFQSASLEEVNSVVFVDGAELISFPTEVTLILPTNEEFILQDGSGGPEFALFGKSLTELIHTDTGTVGYTLNLMLDSSTPADADFLGILQFSGRDSSNNVQEYARIAAASLDVTSGTEDGTIQFSVHNNGSSAKVLEISATGGNINMGFFGVSSLGNSRPDITGSRGGNAALADLLTKLATLGLITDSTT